jgi:hypothetical protein
MNNIIKTLYKATFIAITALYCVSCEPNNKDIPITTVTGRVITYGTKTPVAGATVYLQQPDANWVTTIRDSTKTDINGKYTFKNIKEASAWGIRNPNFLATKKGYFVPEFYEVVFTHSPVIDDIVIDPIGWLKIKVKKVTPFNIHDRIAFYTKNAAPIGNIIGQSSDSILTYPLKGNRKQNIMYYVEINNNKNIKYEDSMYIKGLDTTYYEVKY